RTDGLSTTLSRPVDWDLSDTEKRFWLMLEFSAPQIQQVEIRFAHATGIDSHVTSGTNARESRLITLPLRSDRYDRVDVVLEPRAHDGHLILHRFSLYGLPKR